MRLWGSIFSLALIFSTSALADKIRGSDIRIVGWSGAAYTNDKTGQFSHCAISADYRSGITLFFAISNNYSWRVGWSHKDWHLQKDQKVRLALYIDGGDPYYVDAVAYDAHLALAELPDSAALFNLLRKGYRLSVFALGNRYEFNLDGTYAALTEVMACVGRAGAPQPPTVAAPMAPPAPIVGANTPSTTPNSKTAQLTAEQQLEATTLVANLLAQGDLTGFRILTTKERNDASLKSFADWHVVWAGDGRRSVL